MIYLCVLLCVDAVYYSYGVNGKARAEKARKMEKVFQDNS